MTAGAYLMRAGNGLVKIGASGNVEARLLYLQSGSALPLTLAHVVETPHFRAVERALHVQFGHRRGHGEWFALTEDDILAIQTLDVAMLGIPETKRQARETKRQARLERQARSAARSMALTRWSKRSVEKVCPFCGRTFYGVKEQVYCKPAHQGAAAARRMRERRRAQPPAPQRQADPSHALAASLARALTEIDRYRAAGDEEGAARWEQIAAGIASSTASSVQ